MKTPKNKNKIKGDPWTKQMLKLAYKDFKITIINMLNNLHRSGYNM